jgi:hypothetical protein
MANRALSVRSVLTIIFLLSTPATAHLTPNSEVRLAFGRTYIDADIIIPQGEYAAATGNPVTNTAESQRRAADYLRETVHFRSVSGESWQISPKTIGFETIAGPPDLHVTARLAPPPGASARRVVIDWQAVIAVLPNHFVLFVATSDFAGGKADDNPRILGALQGNRRTLQVDRGEPQLWAGFKAAVALGIRHIAQGRDHLLFLAALLLPAPLLASAGRWRGRRTPRAALLHLAAITAAFTLGHSLTLVAVAAFGWHLPAAPVEIAIALTILVAAIHAWRPLFPGREAWVAAGFGLIHGLAFATAIAGFGLDSTEKALAILGFNIGIELVQLAFIAAALPLLLLIARTPRADLWRTAAAAVAGLAALGWLAQRITGSANAVTALLDRGLG